MEKPAAAAGKCSREMWLAIITSVAMLSVLFCFDYSTLVVPRNAADTCSGKYIYVHDLPARFNADLVRNCRLLTRGTEGSMCPYVHNDGLGPPVQPDGASLLSPRDSWFATNQFTLELIFHARMTRYRCLTKSPSLASAVFVPFYAGLDASLRLWNPNLTERDSSARDLGAWLTRRPEWRRLSGRDHFMAAGRISWDFRRRPGSPPSDWGTALRFLPEFENTSMLSVEASSWRNDHAVPYPTSFHPGSLQALRDWQASARARPRPNLFAFAGAPRPDSNASSVRDKAIEQCRASPRCLLLDCAARPGCASPGAVVSAFASSVYCLQPPGDSYTRRSVFDAIVAGCVPVFFHPGTAYSQYRWHLPRDHSSYSVYVPVRDPAELGPGDVERVLLGISREAEEALREAVIGLIPRVVYADARSGSDVGFEDAFDLAVRGVLERVEEVRRVIREGKDPSVGFADEDSYKFTFSDWNTTRK